MIIISNDYDMVDVEHKDRLFLMLLLQRYNVEHEII